jgi:hypothetical protein
LGSAGPCCKAASMRGAPTLVNSWPTSACSAGDRGERPATYTRCENGQEGVSVCVLPWGRGGLSAVSEGCWRGHSLARQSRRGGAIDHNQGKLVSATRRSRACRYSSGDSPHRRRAGRPPPPPGPGCPRAPAHTHTHSHTHMTSACGAERPTYQPLSVVMKALLAHPEGRAADQHDGGGRCASLRRGGKEREVSPVIRNLCGGESGTPQNTTWQHAHTPPHTPW